MMIIIMIIITDNYHNNNDDDDDDDDDDDGDGDGNGNGNSNGIDNDNDNGNTITITIIIIKIIWFYQEHFHEISGGEWLPGSTFRNLVWQRWLMRASQWVLISDTMADMVKEPYCIIVEFASYIIQRNWHSGFNTRCLKVFTLDHIMVHMALF